MARCADLDDTSTGISMDALQCLRSGVAGWVEVLVPISTGVDTLDRSSCWIGRLDAIHIIVASSNNSSRRTNGYRCGESEFF